MTVYHYAVIERPESSVITTRDEDPSMETVDYKRQPSVTSLRTAIETTGGMSCGIFRGGMFGLTTTQVASLSAWTDIELARTSIATYCQHESLNLIVQKPLSATVRPTKTEPITQPGIYVIRWIRMRGADVVEYTSLCLDTWPAFEAASAARCYGVFRVDDHSEPGLLLMLTWYQNLRAWEQSRQLNKRDAKLWVRRSQMEISHWAQAGRLELDAR